MSLTKFYTFEQMANATVESVSTEAIGHPAEHALLLEPNYAWEANELSAQHEIVVDLGEILICNALVWMHRNQEQEFPPLALSTVLVVEVSDDNSSWRTVDTEGHDGNPYVQVQPNNLIKIYHFSDGDTAGRYYRLTVKGIQFPNEFAPSDSRISMLWFGTVHELDKAGAFPITDSIDFPVSNLPLAFGDQYSTGYNVNKTISLTRTWMLTQSEYEIIQEVLRASNGALRPFVYVEFDNIYLCQFLEEPITETILDLEVYNISLEMKTYPIVERGALH